MNRKRDFVLVMFLAFLIAATNNVLVANSDNSFGSEAAHEVDSR